MLPTRFVLLAGLLVFWTAAPVRGTEEFANPPRPFPVVMGEQIAANLVDLIFLFDRVASDPPTATTPDYLERVSQPSSPFYNDYLAYRRGRIDRAELVRRLPHVAMMGDSLTQHFYISSPISLFWRARTQRRKNWFLDTEPDPASLRSVYGGLEAFFKARRKAEALHAKNPALYPYFESGNRSFESLKLPYQSNMIRLGLMLNGEMRAMVSNLDRQLARNSNVRVQYSDALAKVNFSRLELINPADAWHPSIEGHKALAAAAFSALGPSLKFLEIGPKRTISPASEIVTRRTR